MACLTRKIRTKREQEMRYCNCVIAVFQVMIACQSITFISGQGYLYQESEFQPRKTLQSGSVFQRQQDQSITSEQHEETLTDSSSEWQMKIIQFEPPYLDFEAECVGMPKMKTVFIYNPSKTNELHLSSISARTSHFHSSFFDKKIVPPGRNTSFEVVFLARVVGSVENSLFINTLRGTFPYQVSGVGIPNPYRLRPYLGARVPLNSSFSPLISMHNPTSKPLQVTEMYSSSGYLQLQLPSGQHESSKEFWEIPPYETKQVMRARFLGEVEANHTAFIRIKTTQTDSSVFHIVPMEIEVSSAPGIYSSVELLDFGTLRTQYDEPKTLPFYLLNSGSRDVTISSVKVTSPNPAVSIEFKPIKLKPTGSTFVLVANITYSALLSESGSDRSGIITVKTKEKSYSSIKIPFITDLLDGTLGYDEGSTLFHSTQDETQDVIRDIMLSNTFNFPVLLQNVSLTEEASRYFKILKFTDPVILQPMSENVPFSIRFFPLGSDSKRSTEPQEDLSSVYYLVLQTNASRFSLPLHVYSGLLSYEVLREDTKKVDFGIMGTTDTRQVLLALYNRNPAPIMVKEIKTVVPGIDISLVSLTQGPDKNLTDTVPTRFENFELPTNSCSVLEVSLSAAEKEEEIIGAITIVTGYQEIRIPVLARIVIGTLTVKPERLKFSPSFPGLIASQALSVMNTFAQSSKIDSIEPWPEDKRFYYKRLKNKGLELEPNKKTKVGKVYFDARQNCKQDRCYVGLPTSTTVGHHWLTTLSLGPDSVELDVRLYKQFKQRWKSLQDGGMTKPNTTLIMNTDVVNNVEIPVQASLYWPTLLEENNFNFPLTHVGRKSVAVLTLSNPSDSPVIAQVLPLSLYPTPEAVIDLLDFSSMATDKISFVTENSNVFHVLDPKEEITKDSMTSQMMWLEYTLSGKLNHSVVNLFLDPGQKVNLKVEFNPYDDLPKSTVILLRNNLTIMDTLVMHGCGAREQLKLGGKTPNLQSSVLRFRLTKDLLKDCKKPHSKPNPSFTVRKKFVANNIGMLPIHITSIMVNGAPCEGYGFRVLDCDQFILQPNKTRDVIIAFTPDFTSFQVLHKLRLLTAQGNELIFVLNVTLPPSMLPLCQEAVPRPSWEPALYIFISLVMVALFAGILLMSYLEALNIWEPFVRLYEVELRQREQAADKKGTSGMSTPLGFGKRFDLRNIATSFISTVTSPQSNAVSNSLNQKKKPSPGLLSKIVGHTKISKNNNSQQTDPHPNFPPLVSSLFSCTKRLLKPLSKPKKVSKSLLKSGESVGVATLTDPQLLSNSPSTKESQNQNSNNQMTNQNHSTDNKTDVVYITPGKTKDLPEEIESFVHLLANFDPENPDKTKSGDKYSQKQIVRPNTSEGTCKKDSDEHKGKRRLRSNSKRLSRVSSGSSSTDGGEDGTESKTSKSSVEKSEDKEIQETKPVRRLRKTKLSKRQLKAAQARERLEASNAFNQEIESESLLKNVEKSCEEELATVGMSESVKKSGRQARHNTKLRSSISSSLTASKKDEATARNDSLNNSRERTAVNRTLTNNLDQPQTSPKHYSSSLDSTRNQKMQGAKKIFINKNPNVFESRTSSSQEVSESSGNESLVMWDIPSSRGAFNRHDPDEDMRQLSKQSFQADSIMSSKRRKERRQKKGGASPDQLSSSSRSSSYSSVLSSASSNEGGQVKSKFDCSSASGTPKKQLMRSVSDATNSTSPQQRKLNQYNTSNAEKESQTHARQQVAIRTNRYSPPATSKSQPPSRALSSPTVFTNLFGKKTEQTTDSPMQRPSTIGRNQNNYRNQPMTSSYSAFGRSSFNIMESFRNNHSTASNSSWGSPFSDNSSLYSTPSSQQNSLSPSSNNQAAMKPRHWTASESPSHSQASVFPTPSTYEPLPGTPTTPCLTSRPSSMNWSDIPSPTSPGSNMTTHSIWSVSNAVTMDENRNENECDPLGLKSIWSDAASDFTNNWPNRR